MTKIKAVPEESETEGCSEELLVNLNPIAQPLASSRLTCKLYKCIKKAVKQKQIRRRVKEIQKFVNKGEKGTWVQLQAPSVPLM
ncbi:H/ACA ribonucleoprotein complex subunit 2-like isoform X2 [Mastomys coucha]|uniref:H/ACA ribonucleoprotein complex subunit 2-like isoform X2 n=1 Tax=Mastomys coucha TaxID=35658 RepID=UPI0012619922|nr:H/ACA ribonucleoprotein complex subunit 2-like isoform X2 [Mastomys coucha]